MEVLAFKTDARRTSSSFGTDAEDDILRLERTRGDEVTRFETEARTFLMLETEARAFPFSNELARGNDATSNEPTLLHSIVTRFP